MRAHSFWKIFLILLFIPLIGTAQQSVLKEPVKFLALGDSYTIGESVTISERWPVQLRNELIELGYDVEPVTIIARTGWRTDDLSAAIQVQNPDRDYNLVSLLIGVNDQYQGRDTNWYRPRFRDLLLTAIELAGGNKESVFVVSIPDYAYTPFGQSANPQRISSEIDEFNELNRLITDSMGIRYFNITPISREGLDKPSYVANDGLHPSGEMYAQWVRMIVNGLKNDNISTGNPATVEPGQSARIWFNTTSDSVIIRFEQESRNDSKFMLIDSSGKVIGMMDIHGESMVRVPAGNLRPGIYFYKLISTEGMTEGSFIKG